MQQSAHAAAIRLSSDPRHQHSPLFNMTSSSSANKYSVLLPTYNERQNLPIMIDLLVEAFTNKSERQLSEGRTGRRIDASIAHC